MRTSLQGLANKARNQKEYVFRDLYVLLDEEYLKDCWRLIRKDAAYGVDRVSAQEYEEKLDENIRDLVEGLKRNYYHAKLVRRKYIPKPDGRKRPLGIPATQDKLMQLGVARILSAIYEEDFLGCSYGYRPNRSAHDAVDKLTIKLQCGGYGIIVEADIAGYFDNIEHEKLIEMLEKRIGCRRFLRLIRKWLKAGVLEPEGQVVYPRAGTPQGGLVSPVLANVYLHYVLDEWFEKEVKAHCKRSACLVRYADDFVCGFQSEQDAEWFYKALEERLGKYGLRLAPSKSRVFRFTSTDRGSRFDFLGFEFYWGPNREGEDYLKRRTSRKKLKNSLNNFSKWCKENRSEPIGELFEKLNRKLRGYYNYYGVTDNSDSMEEFYYWGMRILHKWLNRRSQRRSYTWEGFREMVKHFNVPRPRIVRILKRDRKTRLLWLRT
jgi:RNA-directed DNA polymerase